MAMGSIIMADVMDAFSLVDNNYSVKIKQQRKQSDEPFKATQLWQKLVTHLKMNVTCKRRRYRIKQYDDCFTGENAVDVIYDCLLQEKKTCTLITNEITRTVAVKVCQALMDNSIIEVVGGKSLQTDSSSRCLFEDSVTKLYQFSNKPINKLECRHSEECVSRISGTSCKTLMTSNENASGTNNARGSEFTSPFAPLSCSLENAKSWFDCTSPFQKPLALSLSGSQDGTLDSLNFGCSPVLAEKCLSSDITGDEQEQSLSFSRKRKLRSATRTKSAIFCGTNLKPLATELKENVSAVRSVNGNIENIHRLTKNKNGKPNLLKFQKRLSSSNPNMAQTSFQDDKMSPSDEDKIWREVALSRLLALLDISFLEEILPSPKKTLQKSDYQCVIPNRSLVAKLDLSPKNENLWIQTAQEITESRCFFLDNPIGLTDNQLKMQAFEKISRYYYSLPSPIIPENLSKVFIAILGLIKAERYAIAVHALQLAILLLPWQQRKELRNLFKFMQLVADDITVKLSKKFTNQQYVLHQFSPVIIRYELLGKDQAAILNSFILHHHSMILVPPVEIQKEVERLYIESRFTDALPRPAINYCQQVSSDDYEEQSKSISQKALQELTNSVLDSIDMTLKDKQRWLKKLKKSHRDIYDTVDGNNT